MLRQDIIPAIIPESLTRLESRLREVRHNVRCVQVDVLDGSLVPVTTWPYDGVGREAFFSARHEDPGIPLWQEFEIELDLMVTEPERHVSAWAISGVSRIIFHVESAPTLRAAIDACHAVRIEVACAIRPSTPLTLLEPYLSDVQFVQCMGSDTIGQHGVSLDPRVFERVRDIRTNWPNMLVGIDIGVSLSTIPDLYRAGVRRFAAGSAVFASGDPVGSLRALQKVVDRCADEAVRV
ncbi:MAG: hypothetical protein KBD21_01075 [Candidatus Pacebacteria bacterium]|nr:hypothetical protein [Candidatus Paceibacterota bacterium]